VSLAPADVTAVFLAGGKGTRLGLGGLPKPMVDMHGLPLLQRMVAGLAAQGVRRFIILAGHGAAHIEAHFAAHAPAGAAVEIVIEDAPLGTAGSFTQLRGHLDRPFLVVYGDVLFDADIARFLAYAGDKGGAGTLYVHPNDHPEDSDLVDADEDGNVRAFISKPHRNPDCGNLVNAAFYLFDPVVLDYLPERAEGVIDWGADVLPGIAARGEHALYAYRGSEYLKDIGTPKRIERGRNDFAAGTVAARSYRKPQRAIFLDRDGVLNREIDGVFRPEMLELIPGTGAALARVNKSGLLAIGVTNQPAIAKGFMSFEDLRAVHNRLDWALAEDGGGYLDDLLYCPHHPERGFEGERPELKIACECRKPAPGMLHTAAGRHNIDLSASWMIGDHARDIEAGLAAGLDCWMVGGGSHPQARSAATAAAAVETILHEQGLSS
jgi:histidinol-phosphate phosphatase family protein